MPTVILAGLLLISLTTLMHYEMLRALNDHLPNLPMANRKKLLVVIFAALAAHGLEMAAYGLALFVLVAVLHAGDLSGAAGFSFLNCLYFSAETYTTLGFGDLTPVGPVRLLAGVEALNGLVLIGWSASYAQLAMERFWRPR